MFKIIKLGKFLTIVITLIIIIQSSPSITIGTKCNKIDSIQLNNLNKFNSRNTLYVGGDGPGNYSNIQDAINNATNGYIIYVFDGTYYENVVVNKSISLVGEAGGTTIIDGGNSGNTIKITSDDADVTEFTVQHGGIGIYITQSSNNIIKGNRIIDNWEGIGLLQVSNCTIKSNIISSNFFEGINPVESDLIDIVGNSIIDNLQGIFLSKSENNNIYSNNIKSNTRGIEIRSSSNNNYIYHNNFINNNEDNAFDECNNMWDNGYPSGGNYWDDYNGEDSDGDGIGDTPFSIGGGSNKDYYPFINQSGWNQPPYQPCDPSPENGSVEVDNNADLYWTGGDPNPEDGVYYDVYFGSSNPPPKINGNQSDTTYNPGEMSYNSTYFWQIVAWDNFGASNAGPIWYFITTSTINSPPNTPPKPNGPNSGMIKNAYNFSSITTDNDDDNISYGWDWDGNMHVDQWSSWYSSGETCNMSYSWNNPGTYQIRVKSKDVHYSESAWSEQLTIIIYKDNHPPNEPMINGPNNGKIKKEQKYNFLTIDQDYDDIYYYIDWGDGADSGWIGPYSSNKNTSVSHIWQSVGEYTIRCKAKDIFGEESEWSKLEITMPKNKFAIFNLNIFHWIFRNILALLKIDIFF